MSGQLRSKQGCWTCRLRRKKCDESRPHCSTCESLSITCYGYGKRPDWMNNAEEEKAIVNSLKEIVKHTSRRKGITVFAGQGAPAFRIAPKALNGAEEGSTNKIVSGLQRIAIANTNEEPPNSLKDVAIDPSLSHNEGNSDAGSKLLPSADDFVLLMHFLDHVFPRQYPLYNPGILDGGRGWLLPLLMNSKSFHHAALASSAYHRRASTFTEISPSRRSAISVQQGQHVKACLEALSQAAQSSCPMKNLGISTGVLQLVFFELFTRNGDASHAHLQAVTSMYQQSYGIKLVNFGLSDEARSILLDDLPLLENESAIACEVLSHRFLSGTIIWLDIISAVTSGTAPQLLDYHSRIITPESQIKLENIMGCKNWIMLQIGRIAALHARMTQLSQQPGSDHEAFKQTVDDISRGIRRKLARGVAEYGYGPESGSGSDQSTMVNRVFGYMASLYLHLVTDGFKELEGRGRVIAEAITLIRQTPTHLLSGLVAPLFVIGSAAGQEDEEFFRDIFTSPPLLDPAITHRQSILPVLEGIWSRRRIGTEFVWEDGLKIGCGVLLI